MSPENKQRIIGVMVLIAFIALLIPFLFTSGIRKKQSASDEIPINAEKRQLINQQIQEMDNTTSSESTENTETTQQPGISPTLQSMVSPQELEQPSATSTEGNQTSDADANQVNQPISVPMETAATINSQEATSNLSVESATPIKPVAKNNVHTKKSKGVKKAKITKSVKGFWSVQVGSFSNKERVQKLVAELYKKGFHVYLQKITTSKETLTRILVGREASKAQALKLAKQIEVSMKIKGQIVRKK